MTLHEASIQLSKALSFGPRSCVSVACIKSSCTVPSCVSQCTGPDEPSFPSSSAHLVFSARRCDSTRLTRRTCVGSAGGVGGTSGIVDCEPHGPGVLSWPPVMVCQPERLHTLSQRRWLGSPHCEQIWSNPFQHQPSAHCPSLYGQHTLFPVRGLVKGKPQSTDLFFPFPELWGLPLHLPLSLPFPV